MCTHGYDRSEREAVKEESSSQQNLEEKWLVVDVKSRRLNSNWMCTEEIKVAPFRRSDRMICQLDSAPSLSFLHSVFLARTWDDGCSQTATHPWPSASV